MAGDVGLRGTETRRTKLAKHLNPEKARCSALVFVRIANCGIANARCCEDRQVDLALRACT